MGIERITLNFDTDDQNSMMLLGILKQIKRGHRMAVIADNMLIQLEEHNMLVKYRDNPAAMSKALELFSDIYRSSKDLGMGSTGRTGTASIRNKCKTSKQSKDEPKVTLRADGGDDLNDEGNPICLNSPRKDVDISANSSHLIKQSKPNAGKTLYLSKDKWIRALNNEALSYFKGIVPSEQYNEYEAALRMLGDDEDIYEELIISPGLIMNHSAPPPSENLSFEEWLTNELHTKGIFQE